MSALIVSAESAALANDTTPAMLFESSIKILELCPVLPPVPSNLTIALSVELPGPVKSPELIAVPLTLKVLPDARFIPESSISAISEPSTSNMNFPLSAVPDAAAVANSTVLSVCADES